MPPKTLSALLFAALVLASCAPAASPTPIAPTPSAAPTSAAPLVIEDGVLYLAIIWHQHQPVYGRDPESGDYVRPWVRVHATKDYLDMATTVAEYPEIHVTFNITPSLIRQLDDLGSGARDLYWSLSEIDAAQLSQAQKRFLLERFFDTNPEVIARFPRYQQLATMRGGSSAEQIDAALASWSEQDFRDLQVLFNLAWTDPDWLAQEPLASLVARGQGYTEDDKPVLFAEHLRILQDVLPTLARLQDQGQIEVTTTPFAHPILPLLADSDLARIAMPDADLPPRFTYGQDAVAQVERGVEMYREHFGVAPRGMWPAEGSVAPIVISMIANAGIEWIATDEEVLARSLPEIGDFTRDRLDTVLQADALYRPYTASGRRGQVAVLFRDHVLSDKVGFEYSGTSGEQAAADFIQRMNNIQAELTAEGATGPHLVTVLLDGENAWEYYPNDGKDFLHALYQGLSEAPNLRTVTPSEYLAATEPPRELADLWAGSWINHDFSTWIGEEEENRAWSTLGETRAALESAIRSGDLPEEVEAEALETMYIAEGSDWFWWYGADQNSGGDEAFDAQFRSYLEQIYTLIGQDAPDFVHVPIVAQTAQAPEREPQDILSVVVDGIAREGEWDAAGVHSLPGASPAGFLFGFDPSTLFLRIDSPEGFGPELTLGFYLNLHTGAPANAYSRYGRGVTTFGFGADRLLEVTFHGESPAVVPYAANGRGGWDLLGVPAGSDLEIALGPDGVLEIAAPLAALSPQLGGGARLDLRLVVSEGREDLSLIPDGGPALLVAPELPIPNVALDLADPPNDDYGPGGYTYPSDAVFASGAFDLAGLVVGSDQDNAIFRVTLGGPINNPWGSPNGLSVQTLDLYIDVDGAANGDRILLPGRNAALTADFAWDYAAWVEGWTPGIYRPDAEGLVEVDAELGVSVNPGQRRVTVTLPRSLLPGDPSAWSIAVVLLGQEGYPAAGVWRVRDVNPSAEQWRFGGGPVDVNHTRIIDVFWPSGFPGTQEAFLGDYPSASGDLDALGPDDFAQIPMLRLGNGGR
jgi:alpha-amylase/alpha-mannosidase (GH57 family)